MKFKKIEGLIAAPFTPMDKDGEINISLINEYCTMLKKNQVKGAFICGSTGEGVSMTLEEKKNVFKAWADANKGDDDFKVIAFLGGTCVRDGIDLAKYAQQVGLYAVAITAPFYFMPNSVKALADVCAEVAAAVPEMPFYYYHIPVLTGVGYSMYSLLHEVDGRIPNFAGIKYTHEDFMDFQSCMNFGNQKYDMLWGRDENMLSSLILGSMGAVGSTYNYAAPLYLDLIAAYNSGNFTEAEKLQQKSIDMIRLLGKYGGISVGKSYMRLLGLDCGEFRSPVKNMSADDFVRFKADAQAVGYDQFKSLL